MRGYHGVLQRVLGHLEQDILSPISDFHQMTAVLDKISAGELVGRRQDMASNQLLSHVLEQLLARSKQLRDSQAVTLNMQLVTWRDAATEQVIERFEGQQADPQALIGELISLPLPKIFSTSASGLPLIASVMSEAEAVEMAQPWP